MALEQCILCVCQRGELLPVVGCIAGLYLQLGMLEYCFISESVEAAHLSPVGNAALSGHRNEAQHLQLSQPLGKRCAGFDAVVLQVAQGGGYVAVVGSLKFAAHNDIQGLAGRAQSAPRHRVQHAPVDANVAASWVWWFLLCHFSLPANWPFVQCVGARISLPPWPPPARSLAVTTPD